MPILEEFKVPENLKSRISFCCEMNFEFDPHEGFLLRVKKDEWENFFTRTSERRWRYRAAHFCSVHLITQTIFEWPQDVTDEEIEFMVDTVGMMARVMDAAFVGHRDWKDRAKERFSPSASSRGRMFFPLDEKEEINVHECLETASKRKDSLYLMRHNNGLIKIGRSVNPVAREKTLQAEDPRLEMIYCFDGAGEYEKRLHDIFADVRVRGEWFRIDDRHVDWIASFMKLRESMSI